MPTMRRGAAAQVSFQHGVKVIIGGDGCSEVDLVKTPSRRCAEGRARRVAGAREGRARNACSPLLPGRLESTLRGWGGGGEVRRRQCGGEGAVVRR
jgi:hypothetical protein